MSHRLLQPVGRYFRFDIYRRLLPYIRPFRITMAIAVVIQVAQVGFGLLDPWPMQILVDNALSGKPIPGWLASVLPFLGAADARLIVFFAVGSLVGLRVVEDALSIIGDYIKTRVNASMTLMFKADLFNHLQHLSFSYHDRTTVGDSMYRLTNDTDFISTLIWGNFRHLLTAVLTLVSIVWIVVWLDWQLALMALAVAPILYAAVGFYGRHFKSRSKSVKEMEARSQTIVQEVLSCLRVVKAFGMEERERERFEQQAWTTAAARWRLSLHQGLFSSFLGWVTRLDRNVILLIGGLHVLEGRLTVGELLVILSYVDQIHSPLEDIGQTLTDMQLSLVSAERTLDVLDERPDIRDRPGAKTLERVAGAVALEGVGFAYQTGRRVLEDLSLSAQPGEVVAIVGPTGAGKTTLSNLIARFYDPAAGRVLLDGHDLRDLTIRTLRKNIALVIQEPILFTGGIGENIAYGRPEASMEEIVAAAQAANAHDFISALPTGYNSQVGERGTRLSGGERQRIAVARAFLKDAPILILDEPTSSVDSRTELVILNALDRLMVGRTTFIIAHRLSTIRRADQILVIDKGRIAERGTHEELMALKGLYAQFYRIQSRGLLARESEAVPA